MYLANMQHPTLGMQVVAITYALPRALLFWSLAFFAIQLIVSAVLLPGIPAKVFVLVPIALLGALLAAVLLFARSRLGFPRRMLLSALLLS